jgi:hypothetical protein
MACWVWPRTHPGRLRSNVIVAAGVWRRGTRGCRCTGAVRVARTCPHARVAWQLAECVAVCVPGAVCSTIGLMQQHRGIAHWIPPRTNLLLAAASALAGLLDHSSCCPRVRGCHLLHLLCRGRRWGGQRAHHQHHQHNCVHKLHCVLG